VSDDKMFAADHIPDASNMVESDEVRALKAENEALRKDVKRYHIMRERVGWRDGAPYIPMTLRKLNHEETDAAIDAMGES